MFEKKSIFDSPVKMAKCIVHGGITHSSLGKVLLLNSWGSNLFIDAAAYLLFQRTTIISLCLLIVLSLLVPLLLGINWASAWLVVFLAVLFALLPRLVVRLVLNVTNGYTYTALRMRDIGTRIKEMAELLDQPEEQFLDFRESLSDIVPNAILRRMKILVAIDSNKEAVTFPPDDKGWGKISEISQEREKMRNEINSILNLFSRTTFIKENFNDFYVKAKRDLEKE